ncbi:hypothetical protein OHB41_01760 [Streptomyces sp. NBC_01571]|nr:hypothetical protein [Streptomyces sp. NBC_01571]
MTAVPAGELSAATAVRVHGLVVLADWLASSVDWIVLLLPGRGWPGSPEQLDAHCGRAGGRCRPRRGRSRRRGWGGRSSRRGRTCRSPACSR